MKQIEMNIANIIAMEPEKYRQLEKVQGISVHLTSDDGIDITLKMYAGSIVRYLIEGTRSKMTITYNTKEKKIVRKPRGQEPINTSYLYNRNCCDILRFADKIIESKKKYNW